MNVFVYMESSRYTLHLLKVCTHVRNVCSATIITVITRVSTLEGSTENDAHVQSEGSSLQI